MPDSVEIDTLWALALGVAVVVLAVVAGLLTVVLRTATEIDHGAREIWVVGKNAANATINLSLLHRTNQLVADIVEGASSTLFHAGRIASHAASCAGCPRCAVGPDGVRARPRVGSPPPSAPSPEVPA
ncbi:MAG TPA: hypothetical protein VFO60_07400 [Candidatus Dormibacteraeota bacterium]|nr:hypothetical protein [Candidatus Dormibacteraeota bacterium]